MRATVLVLAEAYHDEIGTIRTISRWKAARNHQEIWLKGPIPTGKEKLMVQSLPLLATYEVDEQSRLFPHGKQTPVGLLPDLDWQALSDFLPITMPVSAMPAAMAHKVPIQLVSSQNAHPAYALQTSFKNWKTYVESAPLIRLKQLQFAISMDKTVLIIGEPLPTLQGTSFWRDGNLLIPSGFDFEYGFLGTLINQKLSSSVESLILFSADGIATTIPNASFQLASRAMVKQMEF